MKFGKIIFFTFINKKREINAFPLFDFNLNQSDKIF